MTCEEIQAALRADFDRCDEPSEDVGNHVANCPVCHPYAERLANLDMLLAEAPGDAAPQDLALRIRARIARERRSAVSSRQLAGLLAALALVLAAAGWWLPLPVAPETWFTQTAVWFSQADWSAVVSPSAWTSGWQAAGADLRAAMTAPSVSLPVSTGVLYGLLLAAALALVVFNGWEARRLEIAGTRRR